MMAKKIQAFQIVSEAIDLDSSGFHEAAFMKYLLCLQSLSSYLVEQFEMNGCSSTDDNQKKETKQIMSVICDCAERANIIFKCDGIDSGKSSPVLGKHHNGSTRSPMPKDEFPHCGVINNCATVEFPRPSPSAQSTNRSKLAAMVQVQKANERLFQTYQRRIESARDRYTKQNLELELQRNLIDNIMIAKSKHAQIIKQRKEGRKASLEMAMRNFLLEGPCPNKSDQEKRELYIEVLKFESEQSDVTGPNLTGLTAYEIVEVVFQRTLRCSNHPLTQWLIMVQIRLKKQLFALLKEFSAYIPFLPDPVCDSENQRKVRFKGYSEEALDELDVALDEMSQSIRTATDVVVEILYTVFKDELSGDAETLAFKLTESLLVIPLWGLFLSLERIACFESEWRVTETLEDCKNHIERFRQSLGITVEQHELCTNSVDLLKRIPNLFSLEEKLAVLVLIAQNMCKQEMKLNSASDSTVWKLFGADELVPLLSYVLVQSGMSQFVSECRLLELLIDPKYMLGEDGYSLTSFQTAIHYLEMKQMISPLHSRNESNASIAEEPSAPTFENTFSVNNDLSK